MDASIRLKLQTALIKADKRAQRSKYYNPYTLSHYLKALQDTEKMVDRGVSLPRALHTCFNGRLLTAMEKAVSLEVTYGGGAHDKGRPA